MSTQDLESSCGRLRAARKAKDLTVNELSKRTGININTIKGHEQRNLYDGDQARAYGRALGVNWLWLLHRTGDPPKWAMSPVQQTLKRQSELVAIREIDIYAGAGGGGEAPAAYHQMNDGSWVPTDAIKAEAMFPIQWLLALGLDPNFTDLVRVRGDSMWPEIDDGDWVFVDRRVHTFSADDIYLIWDGFGIVVKSLSIVRGSRKSDPRVKILSANPKYPVDEVPADEIRIIGRVHFRIGRIVRSGPPIGYASA